jgi:hypothetical protein
VTIHNVAPTATFNHPSADVPEGTSFSLSLTDPQDVTPDLSGLTYRFDCGSGTYTAWSAASSKSCPTTDDATLTVRGEIKDKDGGVTAYTGTVTVKNVAPTITSFTGTDTIAGPLVFAPSTFTTQFTDPGADTWVGDFTFSDGTPLDVHVPGFTSGMTLTHRFLTTGCSRSATVKVTDDDGGSDTASTTVTVGSGDFLPPVTNTPVTDKLKNGQVLPVKIRITDCNGVATTGLAPSILLKRGDLTDITDNVTDAIQPQSVSSADTTGVMRAADGAYMYNMKVSVPSADLGTPYTIVIYPYGGSTGPSMRHKIVATK